MLKEPLLPESSGALWEEPLHSSREGWAHAFRLRVVAPGGHGASEAAALSTHWSQLHPRAQPRLDRGIRIGLGPRLKGPPGKQRTKGENHRARTGLCGWNADELRLPVPSGACRARPPFPFPGCAQSPGPATVLSPRSPCPHSGGYSPNTWKRLGQALPKGL